jgi:hypothetical protein
LSIEVYDEPLHAQSFRSGPAWIQSVIIPLVLICYPPGQGAFKFPTRKQLFAYVRLQFRYDFFAEGKFEVGAKIIKAERMPSLKFAPVSSDEMANFREIRRFGKCRAQQKINKEQQESVALIHPLETTAPFSTDGTAGASRHDAGRPHHGVGFRYQIPVLPEQTTDVFVIKTGKPESVVEPLCFQQFTLHRTVGFIHLFR